VVSDQKIVENYSELDSATRFRNDWKSAVV